MKKTVVSILTGLSILLSVALVQSIAAPVYQDKKAVTTNKEQKMQEPVKKADQVVYTCPMHSNVSSEKPGKCPECKMKLVVKEDKKASFTCPMHPEVTAGKSGKCPKCKMNLVEKKNKDTKTSSTM